MMYSILFSSILWNPSGESNRILTISDHHIDVWSVDKGSAQVVLLPS